MNATHSIVGFTAATLLTGASAIGVARTRGSELFCLRLMRGPAPRSDRSFRPSHGRRLHPRQR